MSGVGGKRITYKRIRPNPLFQDWLLELHEEAKQKKSKLELLLKEALDSLSRYPLPLHSGAECLILKGFDKRLCLFLDKRLEVYKNNNIKTTINKSLGPSTCLLTSDENSSKQISQIVPTLQEDKDKFSKNTNKPKLKSNSSAILVVLMDLQKNQALHEDQLIEAAQKFCENDMSHIKANMATLLAKGLVKKSKGKKPKFSLTEEGYTAAQKLIKHIKDKNYINGSINSDEAIVFSDSRITDYEEFNMDDKLKKNNITKTIVDNCTVETNNYTNLTEEDEMLSDKINFIDMEKGSFDIILLIDKCETSGLSKKNDPTVSHFQKYPELKHEYRSLKVGDYTWIAQNKVNKDQELVLPYVVERKRMDDLASSIKDGRFHEQKFRLRKCGLNNVIYMVENHGNNKHVGLPIQTLMQALANTSVQDGFKIHITDTLSNSVRFLAMMTLRLIYEYKNKCLKGHNREAKDGILMTFDYFNKSSVKNKALSVTHMFIKLLLQLKGVSVEKALTITNVYKTPRLLIEAYEGCDKKEGEMLLANLRFGKLSRSIGPNVSKSIYQLFTSRTLS